MIEIITERGIVVEVYDHEDELSPTPLRKGDDYYIRDISPIDTPLGEYQQSELIKNGEEIL